MRVAVGFRNCCASAATPEANPQRRTRLQSRRVSDWHARMIEDQRVTAIKYMSRAE